MVLKVTAWEPRGKESTHSELTPFTQQKWDKFSLADLRSHTIFYQILVTTGFSVLIG